MKALKAFNNDAGLKAALIARAKQHRVADEYVKGTYQKKAATFKGCSLGCTVFDINQEKGLSGNIHDYVFLADQLDVPEFITHLQDRLFERLETELSNHWTERLLTAIPVGADLRPVLPVFLLSLLDGLPPQKGKVKAAIEGVKQVLLTWDKTGQVDAAEAAEAALAAIEATEAARVAWATWAAAMAAEAAEAALAAAEAAQAAEAAKAAKAAAMAAKAAKAAGATWEDIANELILSIEKVVNREKTNP